MKNYHLTKTNKGWSLQPEKSQRATKVFNTTKEEAVKSSAQILKKSDTPSSLKIHKTNGQIQEERTYPRSSDPKESKG